MIKTKHWKGGTEEEYATQHFGFGPQRVQIALRQMVEDKINKGVTEMESYLLNSLDLNDTDQQAIRSSCQKLMRMFCERAEPSLKVIDSEIEKILKVPSNVLLPADEVHVEEMSDAEYENLKQKVSSLRSRVERAALMEALLTAEDEDISSMKKVTESAKQNMELQDMIHKNIEKSDLKTIQSGTEFLCAQSPFKGEVDFFDE